MDKLLKGIRHFQQSVLPANRSLFKQLASGQRPEVLMVGCADSRLSLDMITQSSPGDMFVCRNAGNIIPPRYEADAVSATIEFAVSALKIKHIVICGHSDCGAMKGLLHPETLTQMPDVTSWLRHAEGARRAMDALHPGATEKEALAAVTRLNVRLQMEHLETHPHVFAQLRNGNLKLHGWVFQIETGDIDAWDPLESDWVPLPEPPSPYPGQVWGSGSTPSARPHLIHGLGDIEPIQT